jgi:hypothetical protein
VQFAQRAAFVHVGVAKTCWRDIVFSGEILSRFFFAPHRLFEVPNESEMTNLFSRQSVFLSLLR